MKKRVLCIEDDPTMQTLVEVALPDFDVLAADTLKAAREALSRGDFCALVVDIQLPDGDGLRFLTELNQNEKWRKVPVLVLSDHSDISKKVMAFSFGAEDFIGKPFDPVELNARLSAKVRKFQQDKEDSSSRKVGDLLIDFDRQKVFRIQQGQEKDVGLTGIELKILSLLTKRLEQVYSREQIMNQVWGETFITDRTVDSHVAHLRQKIADSKVAVDTVKNFGYRAILNP